MAVGSKELSSWRVWGHAPLSPEKNLEMVMPEKAFGKSILPSMKYLSKLSMVAGKVWWLLLYNLATAVDDLGDCQIESKLHFKLLVGVSTTY